ncbi:hypothetical protein COO60DRAFT_1483269 [Scenedesmus sp. NREL 46B-D3]|nr:hypothetical protein COO60DRAFT_1483269 [Scenedesmus sp. NREL 46B-D3]
MATTPPWGGPAQPQDVAQEEHTNNVWFRWPKLSTPAFQRQKPHTRLHNAQCQHCRCTNTASRLATYKELLDCLHEQRYTASRRFRLHQSYSLRTCGRVEACSAMLRTALIWLPQLHMHPKSQSCRRDGAAPITIVHICPGKDYYDAHNMFYATPDETLCRPTCQRPNCKCCAHALLRLSVLCGVAASQCKQQPGETQLPPCAGMDARELSRT